MCVGSTTTDLTPPHQPLHGSLTRTQTHLKILALSHIHTHAAHQQHII